MRPSTLALFALTALVGACERPDLNDDTSDTGDTSDDTGNDTDSSDTDTSDTDTGNPDTSDTDTGNPDTSDTDTSDTDTGGDTSTDTGFGWDPLYLYPPGPSCDSTLTNQRGIPPKADGTWAAGRFPADIVDPMTVYQVRVLLRHGTDEAGQACDASGAFDLRIVVTDTASPPNSTAAAARTKSFAATTLGSETTRALVYELETPLVVPASDNLWVAIDGNVPGSGSPSCWQVCRTGNFVDVQNQNFFTNEAAPASWTWSNLANYGITDDDKMEFMMTVWYLE